MKNMMKTIPIAIMLKFGLDFIWWYTKHGN